MNKHGVGAHMTSLNKRFLASLDWADKFSEVYLNCVFRDSLIKSTYMSQEMDFQVGGVRATLPAVQVGTYSVLLI